MPFIPIDEEEEEKIIPDIEKTEVSEVLEIDKPKFRGAGFTGTWEEEPVWKRKKRAVMKAFAGGSREKLPHAEILGDPKEIAKTLEPVRAGKNITAGLLAIPEGFAGTTEWLSSGRFGKQFGDAIWEIRGELSPDDPNLIDQFLQGAGSMVGFWLPGMGVSVTTSKLSSISVPLARWFGASTSAVMEASVEAGHTYRSELQVGKNRKQAEDAASDVFIWNLPAIAITNRMGIFSEMKGGKTLVKGAVEGTQEALQNIIEKIATDKEIKVGELVTEFGIGAVLGSLFGRITEHGFKSIKETKLEEKQKKETIVDPKIEPVLPTKSEEFKFSEAIEERFQGAKGVPVETTMTKVLGKVQKFKELATREYEHLPLTKEFAAFRFDILQLSKQKNIQANKTLNIINERITKNLTLQTHDLFVRRVILDDLIITAKQGKSLPFGFTEESLQVESDKLNQEIDNSPTIVEALAQRKNEWSRVKDDYVAAMKEVGFEVEEKLQNDAYYRHQILDYARVKSSLNISKKLKTPTGRGFLKERKGSFKDINTDYIQAEYEVMSQMLFDTQVAEVINNIQQRDSITKQLQAKAKKEFVEDWHDLIPDNCSTWQPRIGNVFYLADSIPAKLADILASGQLENLGLSKDDIKKVLAVGGKYQELTIPTEMMKTLENLTTKQLGPVEQLGKQLMVAWKKWTLISPRRWFKYNARNMTGDADAAFVGNPRGFLKLPKAIKDLYNYTVGKDYSSGLTEWLDMGGMESTMQAQEMGQLNKLEMFKRLHEQKYKITKIPLKVWQKYWKLARISTDLREALLRYANYIEYKEQMSKNPKGLPNNFGGSISEEIMALDTIEKRAFWLQNDLLGAYDRISVTGEKLRSYHYPFWSWKEINFKRYYRFYKNAKNSHEVAGLLGRRTLTALGKTPYRAIQVGRFLLSATALWSMLQAWNSLYFPDEERDLPLDIRNRPHVIYGRNKKGEVLYFSRLGALGDYLEWFGLDAAPHYVKRFIQGRMSTMEIAKDMTKQPLNILIQGANPIYKIPFELISRRSTFPDIFKPGLIRDRGLHVARSFGLENEYKAIMDIPSKGYKDSLSKFFIYKVDPFDSALRDIYTVKRDFMESIGKDREGFMITGKSQALYNFKGAIKYEDIESATKYWNEYIELGGSLRGLRLSLQMLHPLYGLKPNEKQQFVDMLDGDERYKLALALRYHEEFIMKGFETVDKISE